MRFGLRFGFEVRVCAGVAGVSGFSNNYEFSEYLLETKVFMQWPLIRIPFEFLLYKSSKFLGPSQKVDLHIFSLVSLMKNSNRIRIKGHCIKTLVSRRYSENS